MNYFIGIFYILHGLVHLLYMGHSLTLFELEKGFVWPDNSILLPRLKNLHTKKRLAAGSCILAAISFVVSGTCLFAGHPWHKTAILIAVITSTVLFIAFWDGSRRKLHTRGGIALIINTLIVFYTFL